MFKKDLVFFLLENSVNSYLKGGSPLKKLTDMPLTFVYLVLFVECFYKLARYTFYLVFLTLTYGILVLIYS